jgi:4-hydroxythreonine-4-phosphate dehydrogenase
MSKPNNASPGAPADAPILVTMGEPSGIGPEVAVASYVALGGHIGSHPLRLVGDPEIFLAFGNIPRSALIPATKVQSRRRGEADPANAPAVIAAIDEAVRAARAGTAAAVVTAPINKASLLKAGFGFAGHTEYLAHLTGAPRAVMMLAGADLRVVPLTIHIPYVEVPARVTQEAIIATGTIVIEALKNDFRVASPRLAVAGLNPHAGESGAIGREDIETIAPAIASLRAGGHDVRGPLSPDTMFHAEARARYDAALCMYHDQALIPLKTLAFWDGVNVTLGLPIVRTSPDHGTAIDIAGKIKADARSMIAAVRMAAGIADARRG